MGGRARGPQEPLGAFRGLPCTQRVSLHHWLLSGGALLARGMLCVGRPITTLGSLLENRPGSHLVEPVGGVMKTGPSTRGGGEPRCPIRPHHTDSTQSSPDPGAGLLGNPRRFLATDVGRELPRLRAELPRKAPGTLEWVGSPWPFESISARLGFVRHGPVPPYRPQASRTSLSSKLACCS